MGRVLTGTRRLRGGLPPGWRIAHKTGTGQDLGGMTTGYNDVGLITAPDGRVYAVAVMIASTRRPIGARMGFIARVAREVVAFNDQSAPPPAEVEETSGPDENPDEGGPLSGRVRCFEFPPHMAAR
jgi:beta-lactamase class A